MAVVVIDSGVFCHGPEVAAEVRDRLEAAELADQDLFERAAEHCGVSSERFERLLYGSPSLLDGLRRDRFKLVAGLRVAVAETMAEDGQVYLGRAGHLVPPSLTHVLKVCLGGTHDYRLEQAQNRGVSRRDAQRRIARDDEQRADWTGFLFERGPWDKTLYDIFLAMQETSVGDAVAAIVDHAHTPAVALTPPVQRATKDFRTAARVGLTLAEAGHDVDTTCADGDVKILIKHHTMLMDRHRRELEELARGVEGVRSVAARPGPRYREPGISFDVQLDVPSKVLLVDDEKEFVHTLSERLQTRRMQPAIAYDGEQALAMVASDEPEVIVLDLKMPGIDGIEVLRRVKRSHPRTEVIILTGHGSDAEETLAAELGAFAYLRKPVDIDELTETMKAAYRKLEAARQQTPEE